MIDGLKIEMTSDELFTRITTRIASHEQEAAEFEERLRQEGDACADGAEGPSADQMDAAESATPRYMLEHQRDEHRERAAFLALVRSHLVRGEIYRLGEDDLRVADLAPETVSW